MPSLFATSTVQQPERSYISHYKVSNKSVLSYDLIQFTLHSVVNALGAQFYVYGLFAPEIMTFLLLVWIFLRPFSKGLF